MVLRTPARDVVEIDLFPMKPGERRPPVPRYALLLPREKLELPLIEGKLAVFVSSELLYRTSDGIQNSDDVTWLNRKEFRLSLKVSRKLDTSRASAVQSVDFAATNQGELVAWKTFLTSLRVRSLADRPNLLVVQVLTCSVVAQVNASVSPITTAFGGQRNSSPEPPQSSTMSVQSTTPTQAALLQEQRDLERALRLSLEESRRQSRTHSTPSAPPPSDTMLETLGYSETIVGPDGVEIVQLLHDDGSSATRGTASPESVVAKNIPGQGSGTQSNDECVICFDGPQEAVCVPCGHNAVCMDCAQELVDTTRLCPVCRQQVREVIRLYRV
ncbi:unnamed protein product [Phytophthora fragariaefolia]|uniref:Unnamed protein product n=1 Tax=Phytophthora fragariaefolia TaxID=1490495 RepID=A0A9W6XYH2_9STRA|nr:unnamed protein product [Phytophthora fragariaefolia]